MDFLDKIAQTANQTYKFTTEKTNKIAKELKFKSAINQDKEKLKELYEEIGQNVYQSHIREDEEGLIEKINELCLQIDSYSKDIELNRTEILKLNDLKQCKNCNTEIDICYKYCPNCGNIQEEKEDTQNILENSQQSEDNKNDIEDIN